ncbi:MAG: hypothetical protein JW760_04415 [Spirochaetales bacterium]|nr:hypothetical protein [Spirochaetales bacterium]
MKRTLFIILAFTLIFSLGSLFAGGKQEAKVLNFALSGDPDTLDPHKTSGTLTFQTLKSLYDTLVEPDMEGKLIPSLAESWDISADGKTYTFQLRDDVVFHNGDKLTSADVKATFERILSPDTASPKAKEFGQVESIATPDANTVVFTLAKPFSSFLASMASGWGAILPKSLIDAGHDFDTAPVGTGPFTLTEWVRDGRIVLARNPDYWMKGLPKLDTVIMNVIPERAVQVQGLLTGQVDVSYIIDKEDIPILEENPDVVVQNDLSALILVMSLNCSRDYLKDLRVRQGINHAIDKQTVLDVAYGGGEVIGTFMDSGNAYYKDFTSLYPYDPEKARKLFREAGVGDHEFKLFLPQNYELHVKAGEMYQDMLTKAGLNVQIQLVDWSTWLSDVYTAHNYDMTVIGHTGKLDPNGTLGGYGTGGYVEWYNEEAAALFDKAAVTSGYEERKALYDQGLEIMAREVPFMYLGSSYRYIAYRSRVSDFRMTPKVDTFDFRWTEVK